jgi:Protein of unknown function (DUF2459)
MGSLRPRAPLVSRWRCRVAGAALWVAALALSGCAELPARPSRAPPPNFLPDLQGRQVDAVGVLIARWHTGLVLPSSGLGTLRVLLRHDPAAHYVSIGWGNRRFYTAAHPDSGDALAALLPSRSVVLVQALGSAADAASADARLEWVCADRAELWRLDAYVHDALQWRAGARAPEPVELGPGPLPHSRFYVSGAHYDIFHTCNTWTLAALQYAGLRVSAAGALLTGQVSRRIQALPVCPSPLS